MNFRDGCIEEGFHLSVSVSLGGPGAFCCDQFQELKDFISVDRPQISVSEAFFNVVQHKSVANSQKTSDSEKEDLLIEIAPCFGKLINELLRGISSSGKQNQ